MAFVLRRAFSTTARRLYYQAMKPTIATPAPVGAGAVLESPDLQQLAQKAQGPWKELTNQEVVELYRASFPDTFREIKQGRGDYKTVIPVLLVMVGFGVWLAGFLRRTVGPEPPHTFNNKEWEEATREKLIRTRANPIQGISSKHPLPAAK